MLLGILAQPRTGADWLVLLGLALSAVGDVALLGKSTRFFLGGMSAFAVGHLAYFMAWIQRAEGGPLLVGGFAALVLGLVTLRWLMPHLEGVFRIVIPGYVAIIVAMLAAALAGWTQSLSAATGATAFAASDLLVARERFVHPSSTNPMIGLPLYYLGQVLIALSIGH